MGTIISAIYDDIKLHGSVEAAQAWREREEILNFPDPEEVVREPAPKLPFAPGGIGTIRIINVQDLEADLSRFFPDSGK